MITPPTGLKIFIASQPVDMRKSFDGLSAAVTKQLQKDVFSGHVFVFSNKKADKLKLLYWDRNGFCVWYKRLEKGRFRLPKHNGTSLAINPAELSMLLEGIDLTDRQRLKLY